MKAKHTLYPLFGLLVIIGYTRSGLAAYDPGAISGSKRVQPSGPNHASTRRSYRQPSFIWLGGFGGK